MDANSGGLPRRPPALSDAWPLLAFLVALVAALVAGAGATPAAAATTHVLHDDLGRLTTVTSPSGAFARYRYDALGNVLGIARFPTPAAGIIDFSPRHGKVGALVTILGRGFGGTPAQNQVKFNGAVATVTSASATKLVASVPATATDGPITVTSGSTTYTSSTPFGLAPGRPTITTWSPTVADSGSTVSIVGTNFRPDLDENAVGVNGLQGLMKTSTATTLGVTLPPDATSGRISVTTPNGSTTSGEDLFVAPEGHVAADVGSVGALLLGGDRTVSLPVAEKIGLVAFAGVADRRIALNVSDSTIDHAQVTVRKPDGTTLWSRPTTAGETRWSDQLTVPVTGTYTIEVDPGPGDTGTLKLSLAAVPVDDIGSMAVGGSSTVTITAAGQNGSRTFAGSADQRVALTISDSTVGQAYVRILKPDDTQLWAGWTYAAETRWTDVLTLTETGTYTISVDPHQLDAGALKLALATVPVDVTESMAVGGSSTVTITAAGQNGWRTFAGTANRRVALTVSDSTVGQAHVRILNPDGSQLWAGWTYAGQTRWTDALTLAVTGKYRISVDPDELDTGTLKLSLAAVPVDDTGSMAIGGSSTVTITAAGQNGSRTFAGSADQRVALTISDSTVGQAYVRILNPDGSQLWAGWTYAGQTRWTDALTLATTGTYAISADPNQLDTGTLKLSLAAVGSSRRAGVAPGAVSDPPSWPAPAGATAPAAPNAPAVRTPPPAPITPAASNPPAAPKPTSQRPRVPKPASQPPRVPVRVSLADATCRFAKRAVADPIAAGRAAHIHAHDFFGNLGQAGRSAYGRVPGSATTCRGGSSRAAYWTPALFARGRAVMPLRAVATLGAGGRSVRSLRPFPRGLKVLAGNPNGPRGHAAGGHASHGHGHPAPAAGAEVAASRRITSWGCSDGASAALVGAGARCAKRADLVLTVRFPACWNGTALDSTDHQAHMAYARGGHCPSSHPVAVAELVLRVRYPTSGGRTLRLASGAAQTAHADFAASGVETTVPAVRASERGTRLSGRVLQLDRKPLAGVTLELAGRSTRTDRRGDFVLTDVPAGHRVLTIDGASASRPGRRFARFEAGVDLRARRPNALPYTIWMPRRDLRNEVRIPAKTTRETVLTTPRVPGLEVRIPKGTTIRDAKGRVVTRLGLTPIPASKPPFPLPMLGVKVPIYFTVQPGGAYVLPKGARVIYPNYTHELPGQKVEFYNYDPKRRGWHVYGHGRVTRDGRQVVPDPGVRIYRFTGAMFNGGPLPPDDGPPPGGCTQGGDPVDCATGLFLRHDTDLQLPDVTPIDLTRTYRPNDPHQRAFGVGSSMEYDLFLWSREQYREVDLILPDGGRVRYVRTSPGTGYSDAVFEATSTPTKYYKSTIRWVGGWELRLKDGTTLEFPAYRPLKAIVDRFGNRTTIARDGDKITQITSPQGRWISFAHDGDGRITRARDNIGRTVGYSYDPQGRLTTVTDAGGGSTSYAYDAQSRMTSVTNPRGIEVVRNVYDGAGRVSQQTLADGGVFRFDYTTGADGRITATTQTDPRGVKRTVTFNAAGYLVTDTRAVGRHEKQVFQYQRNAGNLPTTVTDPLGRQTKTTYDVNGNATSVTRLASTAAAVTTTMTSDPTFSQLTSLTDPLGHTRTFSYDARGALTKDTDPLGHATTVASDARGRPTRVTDALGNATAYDYTGADLTATTDPLGRTSRRWVDPAGRVKYLTDPAGNVATLAYDALDRITKSQDVLGATTTFAWDANGNQTAVTDARGAVTRYTYDGVDRLATRTDALGRIERVTYDKAGNAVKHVDRTGQVNVFAYDGLGRRTKSTFGTGDSDTYTYDGADRLTAIATAQGATTERLTRSFDGLDRVTASTTPAGTVGYRYDAAGRVTALVATGQPDTTYAHDAADRLRTIVRAGDTVGFAYDAVGRRVGTKLPNDVHTSTSYDASGRPTKIHHTAGAVDVGRLSYAYDGSGRRSSTTTTLAATTLPAAVASATYDAANRLTRWGSTTLTYDANGNLTADGSATFAWNARRELASVTRPGGVTRYTYDALGRRSRRSSENATTSYLYDGLTPIQEMEGANRTQLLTGDGIDDYLARIGLGGTESFLTDALGSTAALVGPSGDLTTRYGYEPFGRTTVTGGGTPTAFQYTGRENDGGDLYHYRARYYSPRYHRFLSEDPLEFGSGDLNLYAYAGNDPIDNLDPYGLQSMCPVPLRVTKPTHPLKEYNRFVKDAGKSRKTLQHYFDNLFGGYWSHATRAMGGLEGGPDDRRAPPPRRR